MYLESTALEEKVNFTFRLAKVCNKYILFDLIWLFDKLTIQPQYYLCIIWTATLLNCFHVDFLNIMFIDYEIQDLIR